MKGKILFYVIITIFFYSCKQNTDFSHKKDSYKLFNLEHAGWKSKSITQNLSNISYTATLVPVQYYILKEKGLLNSQELDSIYESHKRERVIEVVFQHANKDDLLKREYTERTYESAVKYMSFNIEKDFIAITQLGDTINCSGVTFERNFKLAPFKRMLLHFGNINEEDKIQLVYHDQLFGNGLIKFKFKEIPLKL